MGYNWKNEIKSRIEQLISHGVESIDRDNLREDKWGVISLYCGHFTVARIIYTEYCGLPWANYEICESGYKWFAGARERVDNLNGI